LLLVGQSFTTARKGKSPKTNSYSKAKSLMICLMGQRLNQIQETTRKERRRSLQEIILIQVGTKSFNHLKKSEDHELREYSI
jgi:hypothetical protein